MYELENRKLAPVILLGAGRSGTKFLRSVLASSCEVAAVPYDVGYVWRYGNEHVDHDEFTSNMLTESIITHVQNTLPRLIENKEKGKAKFLVEKTVTSVLKAEFMFGIYPNAKFIHLIRDGRAVTESSMRMWEKPASKLYLFKKLRYFTWSNYKYALWYISNIIRGKFSKGRGQHIWGARYIGMDEDAATLPLATVCSRQWRKCVETARSQLDNIPADQVKEVRYEDLVNNISIVDQLCDFIGISDKETVLEYYEKHVEVSNLDAWKSRIPQAELDLIMAEIGEILCQFGYASQKLAANGG
jgi:hypothetical protein